MSVLESVSLALGSLRTNKMRSALTLLGVIIGIASVIAILTLGHALKTQTTSGLEGIGINDYNADVRERTPEGEPEPEGFNFGPPVTEPDALITPEMIDDLRSQFGPDISEIQVGGYGGTPATASTDLDANKELKGVVRGINVDYQRT
ncbi:ABC transporter inner membrane protein, partial [Corynebacterium diphtheriae DSM 43988]